MDIDSNTDLFCLIGNPVSRSLSPLIHNTSFKCNDINSIYLTFNVIDLKKSINGIKSLGIKGFNVTIPYKEKIIDYLDEIDDLAKGIGAVNTVINLDGKLKGFNTDGLGFIKSLEERNISLHNKRVLVIGAGGASRGISMTLVNENISKLDILNRTKKRANKLVCDIKELHRELDISCIDIIDVKDKYDIVINTTSVGMFPDTKRMPIDPSVFNKETIIYDIIYKPSPTLLLKESKKQGKLTINGLDMLIYQGLLSEDIWLAKKLEKISIKNQIKRRIMEKKREIDNNK